MAKNTSVIAEAVADYGTTDKPTERASVSVTHCCQAPPQETAECVTHETKK
jgi:hypothetical protein